MVNRDLACMREQLYDMLAEAWRIFVVRELQLGLLRMGGAEWPVVSAYAQLLDGDCGEWRGLSRARASLCGSRQGRGVGRMHECWQCGCACDCDGEDTWLDCPDDHVCIAEDCGEPFDDAFDEDPT